MYKSIGIAAVGDVLDINCWSSTPYYFYKEGNQKGLFNQPWSLQLDKFNTQRKFWNILQIISGKGIGGFQYSNLFLDKAERQIPEKYFSSTVISFNQTFPRASRVKKHGGRIYYYIDTTLVDLFNEPAYGINIPNAIKEKALAIEQENYNQAEAVISMGSWVNDSLKNYYNLPDDKIHTILPGANIEIPVNTKLKEFKTGAGIERDLILGFVGKDWERKGLPLLLAICDYLSVKGYKVKIRAIGNCPNALKNRTGLEYTGFINKQTQSAKFIDILSTCDIGCLFSASEALGISTLEFLRLGVPVAGFYHQGLKDTLLDGASLRFDLKSSVPEIALVFENYIKNEPLQKEMNKKAAGYSSFVTWDRCVGEWDKILTK